MCLQNQPCNAAEYFAMGITMFLACRFVYSHTFIPGAPLIHIPSNFQAATMSSPFSINPLTRARNIPTIPRESRVSFKLIRRERFPVPRSDSIELNWIFPQEKENLSRRGKSRICVIRERKKRETIYSSSDYYSLCRFNSYQ